MKDSAVQIGNILTRTTGFLRTVCSHSLQPYRGCAFGKSLCGAGCYVQHSRWITRGEEWGSFLESRSNAAASYQTHYSRERSWARRTQGQFGIFLSSSTEPFQPAEQRLGITRSVLEAMLDAPPDFLILQTHSHRVTDYLDLYPALAQLTALRFHLSIESDQDRFPGLPASASSVANRLEAAQRLRQAGLRVVITVSPLLPIAEPDSFFRTLAEVADAVVIDHFIGGDGSKDGSRTLRTRLPESMAQIHPGSVELHYLDEMVAVARRHFPGHVGTNIDGFAGRWLE